MSQTAIVIYSPTAGVATKQDIKKIVNGKLAAKGYQAEFIVLDADFEKNFSELNIADASLFVALGGDGTVKVAAREIIDNQLSVPLLIIPFGSANVFASAMKIPAEVNAALSLLDEGKTARVDVGHVDRRNYFLVGFSLGYVSSIILHTERELKNRFGSLGYIIRLFWNKIRIPRIKFRVETSNRTFWVKGNSLIVFNACNFYGFAPKKGISFSDGILNLYVVTNRTFLTMMEAAVGIWLYEKPPKHLFMLDNSNFKVTVKRRRFLKTAQIDGDRIRVPKIIEIEVLPLALEVLVK